MHDPLDPQDRTTAGWLLAVIAVGWVAIVIGVGTLAPTGLVLGAPVLIPVLVVLLGAIRRRVRGA